MSKNKTKNVEIVLENSLRGERQTMMPLSIFKLKQIKGITRIPVVPKSKTKTTQKKADTFILETTLGDYYSFFMVDQRDQVQVSYLWAILNGVIQTGEAA